MEKKELNLNLINCLQAFNSKKIKGNFYPVYYGIEVSRLCNFACIMCPHPNYKSNEKGLMSWNTYCKIIDEIAKYAEIIKLHWIGEPLINPLIVKMIKYARSKTDAQLFLSTNGSMLNAELSKQIRLSGLDKIIFSLDGDSSDTFERIRVNGNFNQVVENVKNFVEAVENDNGPICELKIIRFNDNENEIDKFIKRWSKYEKTIVNVMWLSTWAGQLSELETKSSLLSPYKHLYRSSCSDLWFKMQINWMGDVNLCCFDWSGSVILGNINNKSIFELWHCEKIRSIRKNQLRKNFLGICYQCVEWAKVQEYEFWYNFSELRKDSSQVWVNKEIPGKDI